MKQTEKKEWVSFIILEHELEDFDKATVGTYDDRSTALRDLMRKFVREKEEMRK